MNSIKSSATANPTPKGMMFLEAGSAILHEQLSTRILEGLREQCEYTFCDFDDVFYKLTCLESTPNICTVQMKINNAAELKRAGSVAILAEYYPGMEVAPEEGFNVAIRFDLDRIEDGPTFLKRVSELRRNVLAGPYHTAFTALAARKLDTIQLFKCEFRKGEMQFICPGPGKIVVVFLIDFHDRTDKALAKLCLQQFAEIRNTDCPVVSYSKEPPGELAGVSFQYFGDTCGFISFAFEERHVTGARLAQAETLLAGFRNYLHYHVKASKTYLHIRMRKRVAGWLQILKRAKPEVEEREMKTADGRTFTRAGAPAAGASVGRK